MKVFFTADCHFGHSNIIKYCKRPFKNITHMNEEIVKRWNDVVSVNDLVYHVGDFAYKGQKTAKEFEKRLNGDIVHIQGNHDMNNGVKTYITKCMMYFGSKDVFVQHHPPDIIPICDFCLCGHIHDKWKFKVVSMGMKSIIKGEELVPVINVGMDVWEFQPVSTLSILKYYNEIIKGKYGNLEDLVEKQPQSI